jgi:hypothetical protein
MPYRGGPGRPIFRKGGGVAGVVGASLKRYRRPGLTKNPHRAGPAGAGVPLVRLCSDKRRTLSCKPWPLQVRLWKPKAASIAAPICAGQAPATTCQVRQTIGVPIPFASLPDRPWRNPPFTRQHRCRHLGAGHQHLKQSVVIKRSLWHLPRCRRHRHFTQRQYQPSAPAVLAALAFMPPPPLPLNGLAGLDCHSLAATFRAAL